MTMCHRYLCAFLGALAFGGAGKAVQAGPITQGDILVTQGNFGGSSLKEFTPTGTFVQTITLPMPGDGGARGVVVDSNGNVQIYNGTFSPFLTIYNPNTGAFTNTA